MSSCSNNLRHGIRGMRPILDDLDEEDDEEPWLENPVMGAEELVRFFRVRQLLQHN